MDWVILPQRLRRPIRQESAHDFGVALDGEQEGARGRVRDAAALLPIAQGRNGQAERMREFRLRHAETLSERLDPRDAAHLCELFLAGRLRIGIRPSRGENLVVGHGVEPRPIRVALRRRVTRFHGHPRNTDLAHASSP